jgi:hypothetical protein
MRAVLLCALMLPGIVSAQDRATRTRSGIITALPPASDEVGVPLNPTLHRTDDMPAPTVQLSDAAPTSVTLSWNALVGASGYVVYRNDLGALNTPPLPLTATSYTHRADNDYRVTYNYRVVALYPNGHTGPSAPVSYTPPKPPVATEFDAGLQGNDIVFTWSLSGPWAPDYFLLLGPGMGDGVTVPGDKYRYTLDAAVLVDQRLRGDLDYTIVAMYMPGPVSAPGTEWPRTREAFVWGRYRFTILGFHAEETTNDDSPWHRDGKGDEIFVAGSVHRYERSTATLTEATAVRTRVYGEAAPRFPGRISAGGIPGGGIQAGDQIFYVSTPPGAPPESAFPLTIWEGDLYPDDVLLIRPAVFESDSDEGGPSSAFAEWHRDVTTRVYRGNQQRLWQLTHELSVPSILTDLRQHEKGGVLTGIPIWEQGQADQKIGPDRAIVFDQRKIERFFQYGLAPQFTFRGSPSGHYSAGGRYTVRMKIERLPDSPVQAVRR